ncbi:ATP-binding protein [Streptomyces sp. NPDC059389]|uniref:ATP-binding protein n=1 Tax=Streptomyces sp. NPDC059389 TaxID=3346818 RepID=UPI003686E7E6
MRTTRHSHAEHSFTAVEHGTHGMGTWGVYHLRIDADDTHVHVQVEDDAPLATPRVRPESERATGGRGMAIVASLATAWGFENRAFGGGKAVWSEFGTGPRGL